MTREEAETKRMQLQAEVDEAAAEMDKFPRNAKGGLEDHVQFSSIYHAAKWRMANASIELTAHNKWIRKTFGS